MSPCLVVGLDFSPNSRKALDAAMRVAKDMGASLVLVHAVRPPTALSGMASLEDVTGAAALLPGEISMDDAITLSTEWASRARTAGVETRCVVRVQAPYRLIVDTARDEQAVLVVVGTHGRTGAKRLLLGSIAEKVVRHSDRPVLIVPSFPNREANE